MILRVKSSHGSFINLGGVEDSRHLTSGNNSPIIVGDSVAHNADTWVRFAGKQAGRVIEGATDIVVAPAKWLEHMQSYWIIYVICLTIMLLVVGFIYCHCRIRGHRPFSHELVEAMNMSHLLSGELPKGKRSFAVEKH